MRLTVNKGEKLEDALNYITEFLKNHCEGYDTLRTDMMMSFTLCTEDNMLCPENEQEYLLGRGTERNIMQEHTDRNIDRLLVVWKSYLCRQRCKLDSIERHLRLDENYLRNAERMKRKKEKIKEREEGYRKHLEEKEQQERHLKLLAILESAVDGNDGNVEYVLYDDPRSQYCTTVMVFHNISGFTGYFVDCSKHGVYMENCFREGLPEGYEE